MKLFNLLVYASSIVPYVFADSITESEQLLEQSKAILDKLPQQIDNRRYNDDNQVVIELPMDYSYRYQQAKYKIQMEKLSPELTQAKNLLEQSSDLGNVNATYILADLNLYGNYSYPKNGSLALKYFEQGASISPTANAYFTLGFIYSTGLFGEVEQNHAKANMYYKFAFDLGDLRAGMVLGYRHLKGISVPMDCSKALFYYGYVANKLIDFVEQGPIGGPLIDRFAIRISDFQGGIYGKGVGETQSSLTRKASRYDDLLEAGSTTAQESFYATRLYKILYYYEGSYLVPRNHSRALKLSKYVMDQGMKELDSLSNMEKIYLSRCIYQIGLMYLRGEGTEQNFDEAKKHLEQSIDIFKTSLTQNALGLLYEYGPPHIQNISKALYYYEVSANSSKVPNSMFNYGRLLNQNNNKKGVKFIKAAAYSGDLQAVYHYGKHLENDVFDSCDESVLSYKVFIESIETVISDLEWAFLEIVEGRYENALIGYAMAAEQGFEPAQASAAYILYQPPSLTEEPPVIPKERKELALAYLTGSSNQYNVDSTVLLGDVYFSEGAYQKAAACYEAASIRLSSHASWNLGWMYENGFGVEQDFHLAKRHYDFSLVGHPKAYLPVQLALLKLRFRSFLNKITGGKIKGINTDKQPRTWSEWKELYHKIRSGDGASEDDRDFEQELSDLQEGNSKVKSDVPVDDPDEEILEGEDFAVLLFFVIVFIIFLALHFYQQRQVRQRRENGELPPNGPNIEFNFRVIAI